MRETEQPLINYVYGALFPEGELDRVRRIFGKARGVDLKEFPETYQLRIKDPVTENVEQHTMIVPEELVYLEISSKRRRLAGLWRRFGDERSKASTPVESVRQNRKRLKPLRTISAVPSVLKS
jgi:hypothetical protein